MKKVLSVLLVSVLFFVQCGLCVAYAEEATYECLYERVERGSNVPTKIGNLPYTADWNSVKSYTYTNYYFTPNKSALTVYLDVCMNDYGDTDRFTVTMVDLHTGEETTVIDSASRVHSYNITKTVSVNGTHTYYFRFRKYHSDGTCGGILKIS